MRRLLRVAVPLLPAVLVLGGCAERAQSVGSRAAQPPWDAAANPFVVPGWKTGDQASWQQQMTKRAQNQNDYARVN